MKQLLTISDLSDQDIDAIFNTAKLFKKLPTLSIPTPALLQGQTIVNMFYENSTRTRMSFEVATRRLGGGTLTFAASTSSTQKGETLIDTGKNIEMLKPNALVVRHSSAGSGHTLSKYVSVPIINAGDGFHEHPTQGLLDVFTMKEKLGSVAGKNIMILGDIAHSRVARSNIHLLKRLGANVSVCAPPTLLPPKPETLGVEVAIRPEPLLEKADVVMALRLQLERQSKAQIPTIREYTAFWGLNKERVKLMKPSAILMHPGPMNRGVEIDPEVADSKQSVILDQVSNGVILRMSVLANICAPEKTRDFTREYAKVLSEKSA